MPVQCIHFLCETYTQATMHQNITRKHKLGSSHFLGKYFCYNIWFTKEIYAKRIHWMAQCIVCNRITFSTHQFCWMNGWRPKRKCARLHVLFNELSFIFQVYGICYMAGVFFCVLGFLVRVARFFPQESPECNGCKNQHAGYSIFILMRCTGRASASGKMCRFTVFHALWLHWNSIERIMQL